jgi:pyruvate dehydrogenase E1 component alpha subunit
MAMSVTREQSARLLATMLRMRRLEEQVIGFAEGHQGLIRGHFHVYIGQEGAGAGACVALRREDYVFTTHRNHSHVLAKGGDAGRIMAEIIGRADGYCKGRAGTFHVAAPELGILHTSAIVGGCLPLAAGVAYGVKLRRTGQATLVFFGDGAMEEGAFYEALNIAQLWELPVIFYMENNSVSPQERPGRGSPTSSHSAKSLSDVPRAFSVDTRVIDGSDAELVHQTVAELASKARAGQGPFFIESRTTRWPGNFGTFPKLVGGETDISWAWAPQKAPEAVRGWNEQSDPVLLYARKALERGSMTRESLAALDREVREEMRRAAQFALKSPLPPPEAALEHAFA